MIIRKEITNYTQKEITNHIQLLCENDHTQKEITNYTQLLCENDHMKRNHKLYGYYLRQTKTCVPYANRNMSSLTQSGSPIKLLYSLKAAVFGY